MTNSSASTPYLADSELDGEDLYPIREVSRLTGVNPVTLRAWERRYGLLRPHRTQSGHRLYSMADIDRVRAVTSWIERGVAVSKVATIIDRQVLPDTVSTQAAEPADASSPVAGLQPWQDRVMEAVNRFDLDELERIYGQLFAIYPLGVLYPQVLLPVWRRYLGNQGAPSGTGQWNFLDAFLRGKAFQRLGFRRGDVPAVMLVSLAVAQRELEALVIALSISAADADVIFIPAAPSAAEIALMAERAQPAALVLLSDRTLDADMLSKHLPRLEQGVDCPVAMTGPACDAQEDALVKAGLICLGEADMVFASKLRAMLR